MSEPSLEREFERYSGMQRLNAFLGIEIDMEAEISGAIRAIATSIDLVQRANQLAQKTKNVELIEAIAELRVELSQAKIAAANTNERIASLLMENQQLREELAATKPEEKLVIKDGLYYASSGDGPFCTGCHDNNRKTIRVVELTGHFRVLGAYKCPICGTVYGKG
jgi:regulator of replication initiation timing